MTVQTVAGLVLGGGERPLEDEGEDDALDAGEEGRDAEVDIVVRYFRRGREKLAVKEAEN